AKLVRIEWKPDESAPIAGIAKGSVILRAYFQDGSADLKIPICRRAGEIGKQSPAARRPSHAVR
ncbi:MAG TPA: hypothetical protein VFA18_13775, partial [Gemmataceae bacterium]|nr:hypothetical protein [Gemmataceae bacterium]